MSLHVTQDMAFCTCDNPKLGVRSELSSLSCHVKLLPVQHAQSIDSIATLAVKRPVMFLDVPFKLLFARSQCCIWNLAGVTLPTAAHSCLM